MESAFAYPFGKLFLLFDFEIYSTVEALMQSF
jgi:hypothetical protein